MSNVCGNKVIPNRHARAEPAPAKAWGGHPGDGQRPSYRWKTVSRLRGWGWTPVFTGVTISGNDGRAIFRSVSNPHLSNPSAYSLTWFKLLLFACFVVGILSDVSTAQELKRLRYGTTISTVNLPVWVAKESRLFAKYGLDPEVIMIQAGALTTLAIISGELQFSGAGAASVLAARIKGGDIALVACPADSDLVYLVARPEIKSAAELRGKSSAVTRLGSTTHFYLRSALKYAGLNPEKDVTILQLGTEYAAALETGRIAAAALPFDLALPYLQKGWPVLLDLSKTDFVYPASCVVSSRAFVKENPDIVERFLKAYIEAIHLMKKDHSIGERAYIKWLKPKDPLLAKKAVEAYANLFKPIPRVTDRGIQAVLEDLASSTPVPKELINRPDYFRDNGPLEKLVASGWIEQLRK